MATTESGKQYEHLRDLERDAELLTLSSRDWRTMDTRLARVLIKHFPGSALDLNSLTSLDPKVAQILSQYEGLTLCLDGLSEIDCETAKRLTDFKGNYLTLNGLLKLNEEVAAALAKFRKNLRLGGLTEIDESVIDALTQHSCFMLELPAADKFELTRSSEKWRRNYEAILAKRSDPGPIRTKVRGL